MDFITFLKNYNNATPIQQYVIDDVLANEHEGYAKEVLVYGCKSGIVPSLIYHKDCEAFFIKYMDHIFDLLNTILDENNVIEFEVNADSLTWLAYEYTLQELVTEYEGTL